MADKRARIILTEDDVNLGQLLQEYMSAKGFDCILARDGEEAWSIFTEQDVDLVVLDVMLPKIDGFTLAERIRARDFYTPIVFLSARCAKEDVLRGFAVGADDFIKKPFSMEELVARCEAILRRVNEEVKISERHQIKKFDIAGYMYDYSTRMIDKGNGQRIKLSSKENELLHLMVKDGIGTIVDRRLILDKIWDEDSYYKSRSMDVYMSKLRRAFKDNPRVEIVTLHGNGYRLVVYETMARPVEQELSR